MLLQLRLEEAERNKSMTNDSSVVDTSGKINWAGQVKRRRVLVASLYVRYVGKMAGRDGSCSPPPHQKCYSFTRVSLFCKIWPLGFLSSYISTNCDKALFLDR
jgi:hypothetical protein